MARTWIPQTAARFSRAQSPAAPQPPATPNQLAWPWLALIDVAIFSIADLALLLGVCFHSSITLAQQPINIVWISCEDISPHIGCFGDPRAITPNLDQLAREGVRYPNTFTTAGVCAPCRSAIITGVYQTSLGTHHMRCNAKLPDIVRPFPLYLRDAGYYCSNNSKQDYQFTTPAGTWDESSANAHWRHRKDPSQPFFAVFNFTGCHESGIANESKYRQVTKSLSSAQRQDPNKLTLPPYYPDTPIVREDWKRNYELITAMDAWAGDLINQLKQDGLYESTMIFFWSDHGVGLPRAKRWLYDSGTRVPLVVRIPERLRHAGQGIPGSINDQLISSIDFGPTVLQLALGSPREHMQGRPFLGPNVVPRDYVFGARDRMDERYDIIRAVRDKRYRYIRNYEPFKPYYQYMNTPEQGATMKELRRLHAAGQLPPAAELFMADRKPPEELYDLDNDPHEINNLAADERHRDTLERLRKVHLDWVEATFDLGLIPESEIERQERQGTLRYDMLRGADSARIRRVRDVANLAVGGSGKLAALRAALTDQDAVVRYWAATGIGNLAEDAESALPEIETALRDGAPCVRIAAARALLAMNQPTHALPLLREELASNYQWARLQAAIALGEAGELARPLIPELQACLVGQPNKYITRVANRTLNLLLGTDNTVD